MDADVTVLKRMDGNWVVVLSRQGGAPMEFVCESEQQARGFATSLTQPRRPVRERDPRRPEERPSGWFRRLVRAG